MAEVPDALHSLGRSLDDVIVAQETNMADTGRESGFNPVAVNTLTYVGTLASFFIALKVPGILLPYFPATGSLVVSSDAEFAEDANMEYFFVALWAVHFFRRTLEVLFVHDYRRKMPFIESLGAPLYYWFFAFWIGLALRHDNGYKQTYLPMLIVGAVLFMIGEIGNCICHLQLKSFRKEKRRSVISTKSKHVVPYGLLFNYVSCPHYFFEIVTWLGFAVASFVLPALLFLVATVVTLVIYASKKHKAYRQEFDGLGERELYPRNRKALIPFVF